MSVFSRSVAFLRARCRPAVAAAVAVSFAWCLGGCLSAKGPSLVMPPQESWHVTAESAGEGFEAARMFDGSLDTFWRAARPGRASVEIDLGRVAVVGGFSMEWGDAFATEYGVHTSRDGRTWKEVFRREDGSGGWEQADFGQQMARYVRIAIRRTEHDAPAEIRRLVLLGLAHQVEVSVSEGLEAPEATVLLDGDLRTAWRCPVPDAVLTLDLRESYTVGSVQVFWGRRGGAGMVEEYVSMDGEEWAKAGEVAATGAEFDMLLHEPVEAKHIRLAFSGGGPEGFDVADLRFRGKERASRAWAACELAAKQAPEGIYPGMFRKEQDYWTVTARAGREQGGALLDEWGNFAVSTVAPVVAPLLVVDGEVRSARQAARLEHALADGSAPLPSVTWRFADGLAVRCRAVELREEGSPALFEVDVSNDGDMARDVALALLVRPVRIPPPWDGGGISPITSLRPAADDGSGPWRTLLVNEMPQCAVAAKPGEVQWAAVGFDGGDIARTLLDFPEDATWAEDADEGLASGAWRKAFRLKPGQTNRTTVAAQSAVGSALARNRAAGGGRRPMMEILREATESHWPALGETPAAVAKRFEQEWAAARAEWAAELALPDIRVADGTPFRCMKTQIAFLLSRSARMQGEPGIGWPVESSAAVVSALLRAGHPEEARAMAEELADAVPGSGTLGTRLVPARESAAAVFGASRRPAAEPAADQPAPYGQFAHMLMDVYRFTHDRAFLERNAPALQRAVGRLDGLDLLPESEERRRHSRLWRFFHRPSKKREAAVTYAQRVWAMLAWKEWQAAALVLRLDGEAERAAEAHRRLQEATRGEIRRQSRMGPLDAPIPESADSPVFSDALVGLMHWPADEWELADAALYQRSLGEAQAALLARRRPGSAQWFRSSASDLAPAFAAHGDAAMAREVLCELLARRVPAGWNTWPARVSSHPRQAGQAGRMPSAQAAAAWTTALLSALAYEDEDETVHLLEGAWPEWLQDGDGLSAKGLATPSGSVDVSAFWQGRKLRVDIEGDATPAGGWRIHWPVIPYLPDRVTVGGRPVRTYDDLGCTLDGRFRGRLEVEFPVEAPWPRME